MAKAKTDDTIPVTEPTARAAYLAMKGRRSIERLHREFTEQGLKVPAVRTLKTWSGKHHWSALAKKHDEKVATSAGEKIAQDQTATAVRRSQIYRDVATVSAEKALAALRKLNVKTLRASDIRALAEVSERTGKMAELLEGRATERNETITRDELDRELEEMERQVHDRVKGIGTSAVH